METQPEAKATIETPEYKRHRILFYLSIAGVISLFIGVGTVLIATGELKQAVVNTKEADKEMLDQIKATNVEVKATNAEVTNIRINQERRDIVDSMFRVESRKDRAEIRSMLGNLQTRVIRLEYKGNMKPFEPSQLFDDRKRSPYDISQLSLQNYTN
jgi:hypothetical protein